MADASIFDTLPKSRAEARARGLTRYFTGKPCKYGHVAPREVRGKHCIKCRGRRRDYDPDAERFAADDNGVSRKIVLRFQAKALGLHRYFTGKACGNGHITERYTAGGCCECNRYTPDRLQSYNREYARGRRWRRGMRPRKEAPLKLERQLRLAGRPKPDCCEVCEERRTIYFDHCHAAGFFRGWICGRCNLTLGNVKDDPSLLRKLANYLERNNQPNTQLDWVLKAEVKTALESRS